MAAPPVTWLADDTQPLPPTSQALGPTAEAPGLLAVGGELTPQRLRRGLLATASSRGSAPGQPVLWWSPDPRMVLPVTEFRLSRSLRKTIARFVATPALRAAHRQRASARDARPAPRRRATARTAPGSCREMIARLLRLARPGAQFRDLDRRRAGRRPLRRVPGAHVLRRVDVLAPHRCIEDRARARWWLLPRARHRPDRLPAEHRTPRVAGRARDPAAGFRATCTRRCSSPPVRDWTYDQAHWGDC